MAGADKVEYAPLLGAGLHNLSSDSRRRLCLERFPSSITRKKIFENVEAFTATINSHAIKGVIWVDGSFLTEKLNPDDADILLLVGSDDYRQFSQQQKDFIAHLSGQSLYHQYRLDNYVAVVGQDASGQYQHAYWLRQFGFSRDNRMKGILTITVPFLVTP
jgi:hypothetical protein